MIMRHLLLFLALAAAAQAQEFDIAGTDAFIDTKIDLRAQDELTITGSGTLNVAGKSVTPAGAARGFKDMIRTYPVNAAGQGALIGRLGDGAAARSFLIGPELKWQAPIPGRLFLGINKAGNDAPKGTFHVKVTITKRGPEKVTTNYQLPTVNTAVIDKYPRRIQDAQGNLGDNTNFMIVGTEKQVMSALIAAGWVEVNRSKNDAVAASIQAILSKQAYVSLPMSELTLFGRVQDHGMAQGDPIQVIAERHHFRIWKAPFQVDGREFFVGAGTHDIGFDRDQRNNGVTHKIDPDVDKERDYIGMSLQVSGQVAKLDYVMPSQPSKEAITATGATFKSDGRVLVIYLIPEAGATPITTAAPTQTPSAGMAGAPTNNSSSIFDGTVH
jgi:hypothetical protein